MGYLLRTTHKVFFWKKLVFYVFYCFFVNDYDSIFVGVDREYGTKQQLSITEDWIVIKILKKHLTQRETWEISNENYLILCKYFQCQIVMTEAVKQIIIFDRRRTN